MVWNRMLKIVIVTDAWEPQINGVVRTLSKTKENLELMGYQVKMITPLDFKTFPLPSYKSIRVSYYPLSKVGKTIKEFDPDIVHIATEATLGIVARSYCIRKKIKFTTSYHTQFPEYVRLRFPIPLYITYSYLRWFHNKAERTLVPTEHVRDSLLRKGFKEVVIWSRGVDTDLFEPIEKSIFSSKKPIFLFVGRVASEKNIEAFLQLDLPGTKYVVGDGPDKDHLEKVYPEVQFTGFKTGKDLVNHVASADVFVFPSKTDTFGLVMLEAMACGVPVAAYPVKGPIDVVKQGETGVLHQDLKVAAMEALMLDREVCRNYALSKSWKACTIDFQGYLHNNNGQS